MINNNIDKVLEELVDILEGHKKGIVTKKSLSDHIHALSLYVAVESCSQEERDAIKAKTQSQQSQDMIEKILLEYISVEHYAEIYRKTALSVIEYYVTNMIPTVPEEIQKSLKNYLEKITLR